MIASTTPPNYSEENATAAPTSFLNAWPSLRSEPTYVVLGVQGSGTNLLCNILQSVFGVSFTRDRSLICSAGARLARNASPGAVSREMQRVFHSFFPGRLRRRLLSREFHHHARNYVGVREAMKVCEIQSAAEFVDFWYSYHAFTNRLTRKGVKSDDAWRFEAEFDAIWPNRRVIRLLRDPRDNALSVSKKDWGPCNTICAADFVVHQASIYDREVSRRPDTSLIAKYEELLSEPARFVEEFARHFNVMPIADWQDELVKLGIRSKNVQKWRALPPSTFEHLEERLGPMLNAYGYERVTSGNRRFSMLHRAACRGDDFIRRIPQKLGKIWRRRVLGR